MSRSTADKGVDFVFAEARKNGITKLDICFFGGEPLLEADLLFHLADRFIAEKEEMELSFKMSTNGSLLTPERMTALMERKIFVSISLDGRPELNDRQRPNAAGKGSSKQTIKAAKLLLKANPCANVTCVITPESAGEVAESVDYIFNMGFRFITTTLDYSADWTMANMKVLAQSYHRLADWYMLKMKANERFYLSSFDERIQTHTLPPIAPNERCLIGIRQFSIAPNGALYPCIQFVTTETIPEFIIGHVTHGFNEECRNYIAQTSEKKKPECAGCALESRCSSWCACINYMSTGTIQKVSPVVCQHERILMPIVDKMANKLWHKRSRMFVHKHYNPIYPIVSHLEMMI